MFGTTSTASSQYLHPDYLSPLPTTLDAKKSPLAMLAQTCNSIGKDVSLGRPFLRTSSSSSTTKDSTTKDNARSAKDSPWKATDQQPSKNEDSSDNGDRPSGNSSSTDEPNPKENYQKASPSGRISDGGVPATTSNTTGKSSAPAAAAASGCSSDHRNPLSGHRKLSPKEKTTSVAGQRSHHQPRSNFTPKRESKDSEDTRLERSLCSPCKGSRFCSPDSEIGNSAQIPKAEMSPASSGDHLAQLRLKTGSSSPLKGECLSPLISGYLTGAPPYFTQPNLLPSVESLSKFQSVPGLSSYLSYLQSRGGELSPCKDPFCAECSPPLPPHLPFSSMGGLIEKNLSSTGHHSGLSRLPYALNLHERTYPQGPVALDTLSALYSGSLMGSALFPPAVPPNPWVCPWVSPEGDYCTKRCASAEELLVHTRTHWPSTRLATPVGYTAPSTGFHSLPGFIGYNPYYPFGPSISSMSLLRQAYGSRGMSHGSGLLTLGPSSSHFHPYKSPSISRGLSSPSSSFELYPNQRPMGAAAP